MKTDNNLLYLSQILETGSLTAAAHALFIAQPSLSQYIKRIENEIGAELFIRNSKPLRLTEEGQIFLDAEKQMHAIKKQMNNSILEIQQLQQGRVTIGSSHYRSMLLLVEAIPRFKAQYPKIEINIEEGRTEYLEECAAKGIVDFSIVMLPLKTHELAYEFLFEEELLVAMSPSHPLARQADISFPQQPPYPVIDFALLRNEPFIIMKKGQNLRDVFFELCRENDMQPRIILQTDDMPTAQSLAATGIGITIVVDRLAQAHLHTLMPVYFSVQQKRQVVEEHNSQRPMSKAASAFLSTIKSICTTVH